MKVDLGRLLCLIGMHKTRDVMQSEVGSLTVLVCKGDSVSEEQGGDYVRITYCTRHCGYLKDWNNL